MKNYWSLTDSEKAHLTEEDVKTLIKIELMEKGVVELDPPALEELEEVNIPKSTFFVISREGSYNTPTTLKVLFHKDTDAHAFLKLNPLVIDSDYNLASKEYAAPMLGAGVNSVSLPLHHDLLSHQVILDRNKEKEERNRCLKKEYLENNKKVEEVLSGLWRDYYEKKELVKEYDKIKKTLNEYQEMTGGDEGVAMKFLLKAYSKEKIEKMLEWFGMEYFKVKDE